MDLFARVPEMGLKLVDLLRLDRCRTILRSIMDVLRISGEARPEAEPNGDGEPARSEEEPIEQAEDIGDIDETHDEGKPLGRATMDSALDRLRERFSGVHEALERLAAVVGNTVEEEAKRRLQEETSRLQSEWTARVEALTAEVDTARAQGKKLVDELKSARAAEGELRSLKAQFKEREERGRVLREEKTALHDENARLREEALSLTQRIQAIQNENEELTRRIEGFVRDLERLQGEVRWLRNFEKTVVEGNVPLAMAAVDPTLKVFVWNPAAERFWGVNSASVLGCLLPDVDLGAHELKQRMISELTGAMREGKAVSTAEESFAVNGGREVHIRLHCDPVLNDGGQPLGAVLCIEDLTMSTEKAKERSIQQVYGESLLLSLPVGLVVTDAENRVISWNPRVQELLGVREDEALGKDLRDLPTPLARKQFRRHFEDGDANTADSKPHRFEIPLTEDAESGVYRVTLSPFLTSDGELRGRLVLVEEQGAGVPQRAAEDRRKLSRKG